MTLNELARAVKSLRDLQKEYFRHRTQPLLAECRSAERLLDAALENILHPPTKSLFDFQEESEVPT